MVLAAAVDVVQLPAIPGEDVAPGGCRRPEVTWAVCGGYDGSLDGWRFGAGADEVEEPVGRRGDVVTESGVPLVLSARWVDGRRCDDLTAVAPDVEAGAEPRACIVADVASVIRPPEQEVVAARSGDGCAGVRQHLVALLEVTERVEVIDVEHPEPGGLAGGETDAVVVMAVPPLLDGGRVRGGLFGPTGDGGSLRSGEDRHDPPPVAGVVERCLEGQNGTSSSIRCAGIGASYQPGTPGPFVHFAA